MEMKICTIILYLVFYLCTLINAEADIPSGRILHGVEVTSCAKYPWYAQVYYDKHLCGGTLITDKFVITASHCSDQCKIGSKYIIHLGTTKKDQGTIYNGNLEACMDKVINTDKDLALIKLTSSVSKTNCINVIPILHEKDTIKDGLPVTVLGFGTTDTTNYPQTLQAASSLKIFNQQLCEQEANETAGALSSNLCTKSDLVPGQNTCHGDSGGGLFYKELGYQAVLVGVTSFVTTADCSDGITVYSKLNDPVFLQWIKDVTGNAITTSKFFKEI